MTEGIKATTYTNEKYTTKDGEVKTYQKEAIDRQISSENDRHRNRVEQLRRQKQRIKDAQAKRREQEKLRKTYKECITELIAILVN